ncbi:MAG: sensor histidine kinase, partial [Chitinophagaceae bacterium]|nr:sensor histidine kinase [Chitinophagaceae bacterium]
MKNIENIKFESEKNILSTQIEIQEQTLENISSEIHDNIGQKLSLIKLHLNMLSADHTSDDNKKLDCSKELISSVITDLRDLSQSLGSNQVTANGIVKAIEFEIAQLRKSGRYTIVFTINGEQVFLDNKKELLLFRIIQEALNNIIKHADADTIELMLNFENDQLEMQIKDNGVGYRNDPVHNGAGIRNMQKRVQSLGGRFEIESTLG